MKKKLIALGLGAIISCSFIIPVNAQTTDLEEIKQAMVGTWVEFDPVECETPEDSQMIYEITEEGNIKFNNKENDFERDWPIEQPCGLFYGVDNKLYLFDGLAYGYEVLFSLSNPDIIVLEPIKGSYEEREVWVRIEE